MKAFLKRILPHRLAEAARLVRRTLLDVYATKSYSLEGEDMILRMVLRGRTEGFYVDVGAHHPKRFSNTYLFYEMGWSGINIDATPDSMRAFRKVRPRDTNIEAAISKEPEEITFFQYNDPALNSFGRKSFADPGDSPYRIIGEQRITTQTLKQILERHIPEGQRIDFLSIDVEGMDLEVLQSNDWQRFRPEYILVECLGGLNMEGVNGSATGQFLKERKYELFAKTFNTAVFREVAR